MNNNIIDIFHIDKIQFIVRWLKTINNEDIIIVDYPELNILKEK